MSTLVELVHAFQQGDVAVLETPCFPASFYAGARKIAAAAKIHAGKDGAK